ncbi:MAG: thiamine phosphate synthase [Candidatus Omnitrophica bacterium]|nr:thiamine phosphate synthase [Candidatus Omnitrophota bacterium]
MNSRKELLKKSLLYVIIDKRTCEKESVVSIVNEIKHSEVDIIQLRDKVSDNRVSIFKEAEAISKILSKTRILFIVNDYIDIAKLVNCDGIHLGQSDCSPIIARRILGEDKIIGVSCHSLTQAKIAQERGADYISVGPVFPTCLKPDYKVLGLDSLRCIVSKIKIPTFAIGGIDELNLRDVLHHLPDKMNRIAVCTAVCQAENRILAIRRISNILHQNDTIRICQG